MNLTELEIMKRAQSYIESLAKGIDPISGQPVEDEDIINNVRISRCLFYVSDVLKKVIENGGEVTAAKTVIVQSKAPFSLTPEQISALVPDDGGLSAAKIAAKINSLIDADRMQKLTATALTGWLVEVGLLREYVGSSGAKRKTPTEDGKALGLREAALTDPVSGVHKYVIYDRKAQQFIFDNIDAIADACAREREEKALLKQQQRENQGKPWTREEEERLIEMYKDGSTLKAMSAELRRSRGAVKARLSRLGLDDTDTAKE